MQNHNRCNRKISFIHPMNQSETSSLCYGENPIHNRNFLLVFVRKGKGKTLCSCCVLKRMMLCRLCVNVWFLFLFHFHSISGVTINNHITRYICHRIIINIEQTFDTTPEYTYTTTITVHHDGCFATYSSVCEGRLLLHKTCVSK